MKTIIDQETGELIEVEETYELVAKELNDLGVDYENYFEKQIEFKAKKDELDRWEHSNREVIKKIFEKYGIKSLKTSGGSISYIEESMQKRVDIERLKQDGIYEKYLKLIPTKAHLMIKAREK